MHNLKIHRPMAPKLREVDLAGTESIGRLDPYFQEDKNSFIHD